MKTYKNETRLISDLIPYAMNARTHSDEQVMQIASSIKEFGFTANILIDETGGIIAGHGRVMALSKLGEKEVPCTVITGLTEAQKKALVLADNKLALEAGWDEDVLKLELIKLEEIGYDFNDIMNFEFEDEEINEDFEVELPSGDRNPIQNMTFTVSDEQHELIEQVLKIAKEFPLQDPAGINENSNGNALYYICEMFKNKVE